MRIIRPESFAAVPWKNGGGITHEVIRVPADGEPSGTPFGTPFRWRVSVATIDASGPFSNFADYQRILVLLHGAGVRLSFDGRQPATLRAIGDSVEFDGALAAQCELIDGPCTDLNLMVSKSMASFHACVEPVAGPRRLSSPQAISLLFAIRGDLVVDAGDGAPSRLHAGDCAVLSPHDRATIDAAPLEPESPLVFFATLIDHPPASDSAR